MASDAVLVGSHASARILGAPSRPIVRGGRGAGYGFFWWGALYGSLHPTLLIVGACGLMGACG